MKQILHLHFLHYAPQSISHLQTERGEVRPRGWPEDSGAVGTVFAGIRAECHSVISSEIRGAGPERRPAALVVRVAVRVRAIILCSTAVSGPH